MMRTDALLWIWLLCLPGCSAESFGIDSDGDGLSDEQEARFCTDPYNRDTDADTIPDALDSSPCDKALVTIRATVVSSTATADASSHRIRMRITNAAGTFLSDVSVHLTTTLGVITNEMQAATGLFECEVTSDEDGVGILTIVVTDSGSHEEVGKFMLPMTFQKTAEGGNGSTLDPPPLNPLTENHVVLEFPGINPGRYADAGPLNGELWIMTIDGRTLDWEAETPHPYAHAFVQIDFKDGSQLTAQTNDEGWLHLTDDRLHEAVTLTVGALGARYVTYADVNARIVSVGIHPRDIPAKEAERKGGTIRGVVRGFNGEAGVPAFPAENTNIFGNFNIAIVQVAFRNTPLSSMNTGAILLPPDADSAMASYFAIPPNLVLANLSNPERSTFRLTGIAPGDYIVFALAGVGSNILEASQNPYRLVFEPRALGVTQVHVEAGSTPEVAIDLDIDLTKDVDTNDIYFGELPTDPASGKPLETGLLLPMINTGRGFVFLDVNGGYNFETFENPLHASFPRATHPSFKALGLDAHAMIVGLGGRAAVAGFDRPGISTIIRHPEPGVPQTMYGAKDWLELPDGTSPGRPKSEAFDAVETTLDGPMAWSIPERTDLTVIRLNYMTPPIHNKILDSDIGSSRSHLLWEIYDPAPNRTLALPRLSPEAPDYPVLVNYEPTGEDAAYHYDAQTIEFELNAYVMGPAPFDYNRNFMATDVNMNAAMVSQDSWLFRVDGGNESK